MRTRQLGKDGPEVPVICFGTWPLGGAFGAIEYDQAVTTLRAAIDAGLTFLDTAESYFDSQAKIGEAIKGRRKEVFLATKVSGSDHSAEHIESALAESLRLLGTDYIDLYRYTVPSRSGPSRTPLQSSSSIVTPGRYATSASPTFQPTRCGMPPNTG